MIKRGLVVKSQNDCDMNELMSDSHMTAASLYYRSYIIATITHPHRGDDGHV